MPTTVQFRRGTTAQNNSFTGAAGELSIDTTLNVIRVHDGSTAGGNAMVGATTVQTLTNKTLTSPTITAPTITGAGTTIFASESISGNSTVNALTVNNSATIGTTLGVTSNITLGSTSVLYSAATTTSIGTAATAIDTMATATYRSAKYLISVTDVTNTQYQSSEIIVVHDGTTATIASYGLVYTGASARMTFTANITSGTLTLWGTGISANNTVKLSRTAVPV